MALLAHNRSLKEHLSFAWIVSGLLAVLTCGIAFTVIGWIDYRNVKDRVADELLAKSIIASRRLSAEMLLGSSGASSSVARALKSELGLSEIKILEGKPCVEKTVMGDSCVEIKLNQLIAMRVIPHVTESHYVAISSPLPPFFTVSRFSLFLFSVVPIGIVLAFALGLQKYFIRKHVLGPIASLVDTSEGYQIPQEHWPMEIQDIAKQLSSSFDAREQSVYGQIARGVIHDIRTLLHSVMSATLLVEESKANSEKRGACLELLFNASKANLPKINDLVTLTLDGSREIAVKSRPSDIAITIKNAITTNESLEIARHVTIQMTNFPESLLVSHDSFQLERVFTNIIKNGIESCLERDPSKLKPIVNVSASVDTAHDVVLISVDDSGVGLPTNPEKVFKLLKSTKIHGSGLGLIVAKKIVQAHGGDLVPMHSHELGGARFEVRLPLGGSYE